MRSLTKLPDIIMEMAVPDEPHALPLLPAHLETLADRARGYVEAAGSANTRKAYASDWRHFTGWRRRQGLAAVPAASEPPDL